MKVLLVEDHPDLLSLFRFQLEVMGFVVDAVQDGLQAANFLAERGEEVDILLAEWEQSFNRRLTLGEGTVEMAREKNIAIILMTTDPGKELDLYALGASKVLVKSFSKEALREALKEAVR